ncbi:MAG: hypothetical protein ACI865_000995 [Flavobacteriaceae bacterium]|jgi:hypothetical protein
MKYLIYSIFLIFISSSFCSCEGFRVAEGTVVDASSDEPLDSVLIEVLSGWHQGYTDSSGYFSVQNEPAICSGECPNIEVKFSKDGYTSLILTNEECSGKIELKK